MIKGITKRWMLNTLSVILAIILLIVVTLIISLSYMFQSQIESDLHAASNELSVVFPGFHANPPIDFASASRDYIENFDKKESMAVMVLNSSGRVVLTSTGFLPSEKEQMTDFDEARTSGTDYAFWHGKLLSGERAIFSAIIIVAGIGVVVMVVLSGLSFIRSIVKPIRRLSETAAQIAQGDFSASEKIEHKYDDEIGDLCDAISDMAKDLQTTEQMKNDFISRVSHELRTPLTAIKGWAETMQLSENGTIDRRTFERGMGVIVKESGRLTSIVEELLDFGRIQSGRMVLIKEKIDILAEFDETVYMLKERAVEEGIHLLYDDTDVVLPPVYGDRNRLRQVFLNILDNALKYTPKGGVVAAQVIYSEDEPDVIKITVTDSGCGISAEDLPKVKEKFYKANQTVGGSGIGLAVADEIMNLHNGRLDIESGVGVGTTVTLTFPIYKEGEEETKPETVKL